MSSCSVCQSYTFCKVICKTVEAILPKPRGGGHRKEFSTGNIEEVYNYMKSKESGWQHKTMELED
jgi:hypothetical protein